jgi:hypothetical protein
MSVLAPLALSRGEGPPRVRCVIRRYKHSKPLGFESLAAPPPRMNRAGPRPEFTSGGGS